MTGKTLSQLKNESPAAAMTGDTVLPGLQVDQNVAVDGDQIADFVLGGLTATVATGAPGSNAAIVVAGEGATRELQITVPRGNPGADGGPGQNGNPGLNGVGLLPRGVWSNVTAYAQYDLVEYSGSSYWAADAHTGSQPPSAHWVRFTSKGDAGEVPRSELDARLAVAARRHVSQDTFGDPVPDAANGTIANITPIFARRARKAGRVIGMGGNNPNAQADVPFRMFSLSGGVYTQIGVDLAVTFPTGVFTLGIGSGLPGNLTFAADTAFGVYPWSTNGKLTVGNLQAPATLYHTHAGNFVGGAQGALVSAYAVQFWIKVEYEDGEIETLGDVERTAFGETVTVGRFTGVVQASAALSDSTNFHFVPLPMARFGRARGLRIGAAAVGPMHVGFARPAPAGSAKPWNLYATFLVTLGSLGANDLTAQLPSNIPTYDDTVIGFYCITNGGKISYENSSSLIGTPGHGYTMAVSGGMFGLVDFTNSSSNRRYEFELDIEEPVSQRRLRHARAGIIVDIPKMPAYLPPGVIPTGTWTFTAGMATSGSVGLANPLSLDRGQAWDKNEARAIFQLGGPTDRAYFGLRDFSGNYSSISEIDGANDLWKQYAAWIGGSSFPAGVYQQITQPHPSSGPVGSADDMMIEYFRDGRWFVHKLTNLRTSEESVIEKNFNTWVNASDLNAVGLHHGGIVIGASTGVVKVKGLLQRCCTDKPRILAATDSMGHSRASWPVAWLPALLRNCRGGGVLQHVDGQTMNTARIILEQTLDLLPTIEIVLLTFGMNDTDVSLFQTMLTAAVQVAQRRNKKVVICAVPPRPTDNLPFSDLNPFIYSLAASVGATVIPFDRGFSADFTGSSPRIESLFSDESGALDVHFRGDGPADGSGSPLGHIKAYKLAQQYAPELEAKPYQMAA